MTASEERGRADARDATADGRDIAADVREEVADERDLAADVREEMADERDLAADARDDTADDRDVVADARDAVGGGRDVVAEAREAQLLEWASRLEARAEQLGLVPIEGPASDQLAEAGSERDVVERRRSAMGDERVAAGLARQDESERRLAQRRDTLLAAAFAGIAEHLFAAETPEELLTRVAEAAVSLVAGSTTATVALPDPMIDPPAASLDPAADVAGPAESVLTFPFDAAVGGDAGKGLASLNIFASTPDAFDQAAHEVGFILAAYASLAARAVGERVRLERLGHELERALLSRDVIGQAKGILMERLKTTDQEAFDILKSSSQRLNIKLREVAQTLAETGELDQRTPGRR